MNRNTIGIVALIITGLVCGNASGNWEVVETSAGVVRADGTKAAAEVGLARAAAAGHVDSDGVIDLVVGHEIGEAGGVAVYFGNEAFRAGIKREMDRAVRGEAPADPFLPEAVLFDLPFAPDWVAVGDFDADGARDVACAARGRSELIWLAGDGRGSLGTMKSIALPGPATAMISGEVNRRDAMTDVVVAVETISGSGLVVFEHPVGAFNFDPEWHPTAAPVTDIALGRLDGDGWIDIAVAAEDLVVVFGRDRKLGLTRRQQDEVLPAEIKSIELESLVNDLVVGRFSNLQHNEQLAVRRADGVIELVSVADRSFVREEIGLFDPPAKNEAPLTAANIAYGAGTDLIARSTIGAELEVFDLSALKSGAPRLEPQGAVGADVRLIVWARLNRDARDDLIIFADGEAPAVVKTVNQVTYVVNSIADPGTGGCDVTECTLREAIVAANAGGAAADIVMNLPFAGATIGANSELPSISQSGVVIDGTAGSNPIYYPVTLDGSGAGSGTGLTVDALLVTVTDTAIGGWPGSGLVLDSKNALIEGCRFGMTGGGAAMGNDQSGIIVYDDDNTIGGTTATARNIVSGNGDSGILVFGIDGVPPLGDPVMNTTIQGNFIGTSLGGGSALGNGEYGITLEHTTGTQIGDGLGIDQGGNVVSGNGICGVFVKPHEFVAGSPAIIVGNYVGLSKTGSSAIPNSGAGLDLWPGNPVTVGGGTPSSRNVISGNTGPGVEVRESSLIQGNIVGLDATGESPMANEDGIAATFANKGCGTIGGTAAGLGNTISGNSGFGVATIVDDLSGYRCTVVGNVIGTNEDGDSGLGNGGAGIQFEGCGEMTQCEIGEEGVPGSGNIVASNGGGGIVVEADSSQPGDGVVIAENTVGSATSSSLGNVMFGVSITEGTNARVVNNLVAGNAAAGITVNLHADLEITGNQVFQNGSHGVSITDTSTIGIMSNIVGSNLAGDSGLGNGAAGIVLENVTDADVGELNQPSMANIVVSNSDEGLKIDGGSGVYVQTNDFGDPTNSSMGNGADGVLVHECPECWVVDNGIYDNVGNGVTVTGTTSLGVRLDTNSTRGNGGLAIDLGDDGVTLNDAGDADTGPNTLLNFPVLTGADQATGTVTGTFDTAPGAHTQISVYFFESDACDPSGYGEAEDLLGGPYFAVDGSGHADISYTFPNLTAGRYLTAIARDGDMNTSEVSACIEIAAVQPQEITIECLGGYLTISEGEPTAEIDIVMTTSDGGVSEVASSVDFETYDDGAVAGQDYVYTSGTKLFPVGTVSGAVQTVEVDLIDDILVEFNEDFVLEITNPVGAVLGSQIEFPVTILDNDMEAPLFADDFESGDTLGWDSTVS